MDFITILSVLLYVGTFGLGFWLDYRQEKKVKARKVFIVWLYVFLCFGYMVGSDWDVYELNYTEGFAIYRYLSEPISYFLFSVFPKILPDFWIFCGIAKCIYLYTLIKLLQSLTNKWLSALVLMMPFFLLYMLISNPLRYMMGLCVINVALLLIVKNIMGERKIRFLWAKIVGLVMISFCFQNTCIVFLATLPLVLLYKPISKMNRAVLFLAFLLMIYLTSDVSVIAGLRDNLNTLLSSELGMKDYSEWYEYENNSNLLSPGNLFKIFFLLVVLFYRDMVSHNYRNGQFLYGVSIIALFLERIFLLIPTAFRLAIPFDYFYIVFFICCLSFRYVYVKVIILYATFLLCKNIWFSYDMIPYSNSIPYIVTKHKPYSERLLYNKDAYHIRTGRDLGEEK